MPNKIINNIEEIEDLVNRTTTKLKHVQKGIFLMEEIDFTIRNIVRAAELIKDVKYSINALAAYVIDELVLEIQEDGSKLKKH